MQYPLDLDTIGLLIIVLSQFIIIAMSYQSLKERVKHLEEKIDNYADTHSLIIELTTKVDLLYNTFIEKHLTP